MSTSDGASEGDGPAPAKRYPKAMTAAAAETDWADAAEGRVLDAAITLAPSLGWTSRTVRRAAAQAGLSPADAGLLLPGGPADLAALLWRRQDAAGLEALDGLDPRSLKVRDRIQRAVQARVEAAAADEAATRRLLGFLALPNHMPLGARLLWDSADGLWRWAGDAATDENHYSKRAILSGVLGPAIAIRLTSGRPAADDYVFRRIADVTRFESWKAGLPKTDLGLQLAGALGKLRYGLKPKPDAPPPAA